MHGHSNIKSALSSPDTQLKIYWIPEWELNFSVVSVKVYLMQDFGM